MILLCNFRSSPTPASIWTDFWWKITQSHSTWWAFFLLSSATSPQFPVSPLLLDRRCHGQPCPFTGYLYLSSASSWPPPRPWAACTTTTPLSCMHNHHSETLIWSGALLLAGWGSFAWHQLWGIHLSLRPWLWCFHWTRHRQAIGPHKLCMSSSALASGGRTLAKWWPWPWEIELEWSLAWLGRQCVYCWFRCISKKRCIKMWPCEDVAAW